MFTDVFPHMFFAAFIFAISSTGFNPRNFFSPSPGGWTEPFEKNIWRFVIVLANVIFLSLAWGMVNLPELRDVMTFYIALFLASSIITAGEIVSPEKYPWAFFAKIPRINEIAIGIILGVIWIIISVQPMVPTKMEQHLSLVSQPILREILIMFLIILLAATEEYFFGGIMLPSFTEALGIAPALFLNALFFGWFHYAVYNAEIISILRIACFRLAADSLNLRTRSAGPSFIAHVIINLSVISFV